MGRYIKTRIVTSGLIYANDAGNTKSYSGVGTAVKNLVGYGATNTTFNQTFVSSGTTSYFVSTGSTSYISNTNVSVSPSSGFTVSMMVKSQSGTSSEWNYWFENTQGTDAIKFGSYGTSSNWSIKKNTPNEGDKIWETTSLNGTYKEFLVSYSANLSDYLGIVTSNVQTTWTVPVGVTTVTAVCVGGGGGGGGNHSSTTAGGGGGGSLCYGTFSVTPGETLYIQAGAGGSGGNNRIINYYAFAQPRIEAPGTDGGDSYIKKTGHSATGNDILLFAGGGKKGEVSTSYNAGNGGIGGTSFGYERGGGGNGGDAGNGMSLSANGGGGGGAGGYVGAGGSGGQGNIVSNTWPAPNNSILRVVGLAGTGGAGGGGASHGNNAGSGVNNGGGVGVYDGTRGTAAGGTYDVNDQTIARSGSSGSGGQSATAGSGSASYFVRGRGGIYGGGGGNDAGGDNSSSSWKEPSHGGRGVVRIVWGPDRTFTTNTTVPQVIEQILTTSLSSSSWSFVVFGVSSDNKVFVSVNGQTKTFGESSSTWDNFSSLNLDKIFGTGTSNYSCLWNNVMIYNRELTNDEIKINFEAYRRKFNL